MTTKTAAAKKLAEMNKLLEEDRAARAVRRGQMEAAAKAKAKMKAKVMTTKEMVARLTAWDALSDEQLITSGKEFDVYLKGRKVITMRAFYTAKEAEDYYDEVIGAFLFG